jgi:hypothetical protein
MISCSRNRDLQSWTRDDSDGDIEPDWLRVGTDIVGRVGGMPAPTFNAAFVLNGVTVPAPIAGGIARPHLGLRCFSRLGAAPSGSCLSNSRLGGNLLLPCRCSPSLRPES